MRKQGSFRLFSCPKLEVGGGEARGVTPHPEPVLSQTPSLTGEWKDTLCLKMPSVGGGRGAHIQKTKAQTKKRGEGNVDPRNRVYIPGILEN